MRWSPASACATVRPCLADGGLWRRCARGEGVATFGPWSSPYDRPVAATYAALTAAGAQRVVLLGASQGAALALAIAPALDPRPAGVVSLSAVAPHPGADRDVRRPRPVHV